METVFHLELCCEETNSTKKVDLVFPSLPATFLEIKKEVELRCSVPVCVQTLYYQSSRKADSDDLISSYIRSGDTFLISYPIEGECERVINVTEWLKQIAESLQENFKESRTMNSELAKKYISLFPKIRASHILYPWSNKVKYVNKLHFVSLGGVEVLMACCGYLQRLRQGKVWLFRRDSLEATFCLFITNFTQTLSLRRQVEKYGGLDYCINAFLWKSLGSEPLEEAHLRIIKGSFYAICNISELPEVKLELAKRSDVLEQTFQAAYSSLYPCKMAVAGMAYLICLAECPEAHVHILKPSIVHKIIELCDVKRTSHRDTVDALMALESYAGIILSEMILRSARYLLSFPVPLLKKMIVLMERVCDSNPADVRTYEMDKGFTWESFVPFVSYLYSPVQEIYNNIRAEELKDLLMKLQDLSIEVLLHALEVAVGRETHLKIMIKEGLLNYIVALPWHVPESSRERARNLIQEVSKLVQIGLPSLCSLVKAKLAKESLGLKKVLEIESVTDLCLHMKVL